MRILLATFALTLGAACTKSSETVRPTADPSTKPLPPSPSTSPKLPPSPDVTRIVGDLEGTLSLRSHRVVVGEPIVANVDVRPLKSALKVFVGGDQRNEAAYPMRIALKAFDDKGAVVCDLVDKPAIPSFGGIGSEQTVKVGETFHETAVLDAVCPAFATPGDYRVILHRRFAPGGLTVTKPGSTIPLSCDYYPVHEGPIPAGYEPKCTPLMDALPSITSEIMLHVAPFDAAAVRLATEARLHEASAATPIDEVARSRVSVWICGWVSCACPASPPGLPLADKDVVGAIPAALPKTFPRACRTAPP
jgi:hypothetical protein